MVHTGVAKPVCSCAGMLSLLLPISGHLMLPVLKVFLFLKKKQQQQKIHSPKQP